MMYFASFFFHFIDGFYSFVIQVYFMCNTNVIQMYQCNTLIICILT